MVAMTIRLIRSFIGFLLMGFAVAFILKATVKAEALDSLVSIRTSVMNDQGLPSSGGTSTTEAAVDAAINRANLAVADQYPAVPRYDTVYATKDSSMYPWPSDFLRLAWMRTNHDDTVQFRPHGDYFWRHPSTKGVDTIIVAYFAKGNQMSADGDTTNIHSDFRKHIVSYANYLISRLRNDKVGEALYLQASGMKEQ